MNEVNSYLIAYTAGHQYWTGGKDVNGDDIIQWLSDEQEVSGTLWMVGQPNHDDGDCASLLTANGLLVTNDCETQMPSLCRLYA